MFRLFLLRMIEIVGPIGVNWCRVARILTIFFILSEEVNLRGFRCFIFKALFLEV